MPSEVSAVTKIHDIIEWVLPQIAKFPRSQRYTLGDRLEKCLFDILELLIQAAYSKEKSDKLIMANIKLEIVRHLVRICYKLAFFNIRKYEYLSLNLDEAGRMIGGWLKSLDKK